MTPRSTAVDVEEIRTTASEKLLATVLAVFLLIGGIWTYDKLDEWARAAVDPGVAAEDRTALDRSSAADAATSRAIALEGGALRTLTLAREEYRTALDADRPATELRLEYEAAQRAYAAARAATRGASQRAAALHPAAEAAAQRISAEEGRAADREALLGFALRFAFVVLLLVAALRLLVQLRRSGSRWLPLAFSALAAATLMAFVLAGDYGSDYVDPLELGPLVLSLVGAGLTLVAFATLQRYLARRMPVRRVRKQECPFCGYPVGDGAHCEGCGREVVAPCARCSAPRRVGTLHCRACGEA